MIKAEPNELETRAFDGLRTSDGLKKRVKKVKSIKEVSPKKKVIKKRIITKVAPQEIRKEVPENTVAGGDPFMSQRKQVVKSVPTSQNNPLPKGAKLKERANKSKPPKKKGCRDYFLGSCLVVLALNVILLGVLIYYARQAYFELQKMDTEQLTEFLDEKFGADSEALFEKIITPVLEEQMNNANSNLDETLNDSIPDSSEGENESFPIYVPPEDETTN